MLDVPCPVVPVVPVVTNQWLVAVFAFMMYLCRCMLCQASAGQDVCLQTWCDGHWWTYAHPLQVIDGFEVVKAMEAAGSSSGDTAFDVIIAHCGKADGAGTVEHTLAS